MLAALASATMPNVAVVGVRDSEQKNETDQAASIDQAVEDALDGCRSGAHNIILRNAALRPGFHPCLSRHADGIELDMLD